MDRTCGRQLASINSQVQAVRVACSNLQRYCLGGTPPTRNSDCKAIGDNKDYIKVLLDSY